MGASLYIITPATQSKDTFYERADGVATNTLNAGHAEDSSVTSIPFRGARMPNFTGR